MGGCPGEVEEEGRAVEGKQGMEEVTWTDWSLVVQNKEHDHLQHRGRETREADGGGNAWCRQVGSVGRLQLNI